MKRKPCIFFKRFNFELKKLNAEVVVIANDKIIYQHASIIPAIDTKNTLNSNLFSTDINCE